MNKRVAVADLLDLKRRLSEDSALHTPSSWDSNISNYSLESSLLDLPAVPEPHEKLGQKHKSDSSFALSELDSLTGSLCHEALKDDTRGSGTTTTSKPAREHTSTAKASLADRCKAAFKHCTARY